jgi:hypothetical protein
MLLETFNILKIPIHFKITTDLNQTRFLLQAFLFNADVFSSTLHAILEGKRYIVPLERITVPVSYN